MPNLALRLMIGDAEFRAIGHVAAQWAFLEDQIDWCLKVLLAQPAAMSLAQQLPTSFDRRLRLLRECASTVFKWMRFEPSDCCGSPTTLLHSKAGETRSSMANGDCAAPKAAD